MNKETIANNIEEFTAWIQGQSVLVGASLSMQDASIGKLTWKRVNSFKDWFPLDTKYVLDDKYSNLRKAQSEGLIIQYHYIDKNTDEWRILREHMQFNSSFKYRIKPEEPKFKRGQIIYCIDKTSKRWEYGKGYTIFRMGYGAIYLIDAYSIYEEYIDISATFSLDNPSHLKVGDWITKVLLKR